MSEVTQGTELSEERKKALLEFEIYKEDYAHFFDYDYDLDLYPGCKIIREYNMDEELKHRAIEIIVDNYIKHLHSYHKMSKAIKFAMDEITGQKWHVASGRGFSFTIDFSENLFYVSIDDFVGIMLWRCPKEKNVDE